MDWGRSPSAVLSNPTRGRTYRRLVVTGHPTQGQTTIHRRARQPRDKHKDARHGKKKQLEVSDTSRKQNRGAEKEDLKKQKRPAREERSAQPRRRRERMNQDEDKDRDRQRRKRERQRKQEGRRSWNRARRPSSNGDSAER